jgi:hypothetical protein
MDILNWVYLIKNKFTRTTVENPATDLVVLGADVSYQKRGDKYQNYVMTVEDFAASLPTPDPGYKVWTGLFTQSGTNVPVVTELKNEIGVSLAWGRSSAGNYFAGDVGPQCPDAKTVFFVSDPSQGGNLYGTTIESAYMWTYNSGAARYLNFLIRAIDNAGNLTPVDWNSPKVLYLEIRVYN